MYIRVLEKLHASKMDAWFATLNLSHATLIQILSQYQLNSKIIHVRNAVYTDFEQFEVRVLTNECRY